jgi:2-polyprenyl-3-methyl-5-hydroxy-6-metoxy-1,4-benzoquinol methylase
MSAYEINRNPYGTHCLIAREIGRERTVLDAGCNKGYLKTLAGNNVFYGIDHNDEDLADAKSAGYREVYKLDLNHYEQFKSGQKFDVIVFADILEHLIYPDKALSFFTKNYLNEGGKVIISLPNVAHFSTRLSLLLGNFDSAESGILDKTHLHLYTLKTARLFIKPCGLRIIKEKFSSNNFGKIIELFPFLGSLLGFNLIFVCQKQ